MNAEQRKIVRKLKAGIRVMENIDKMNHRTKTGKKQRQAAFKTAYGWFEEAGKILKTVPGKDMGRLKTLTPFAHALIDPREEEE